MSINVNNWVAVQAWLEQIRQGFWWIKFKWLKNILRIISLNDMKLANVYNKGHQFIIKIIKYEMFFNKDHQP
jgi:hypothetical protein